MDTGRAVDWFRSNRWWVALILVITLGYLIGKDRALRDNRLAAAQTAGAN